MDTKKFFETVYGSGTGRAVIVLPNYSNKPVNDHWFQYPEDIDKMVTLVHDNANRSVWYSPVLFNSDSRTKENAKALNVAAADADTCDPNNFRVQPDITVETSPGHWHVYWVLREGTDPQEVAKLNRRIAQVHKSEGCDTAFVNSAKLLRVPDTSNHKHPGAIVVVADVGIVDVRADFDIFSEYYPDSEVPDAISVINTPAPEGLAEYIAANRASLLQGLPNAMGLRDMLFGKFQEDKRSDVRYKLLCELYRLGLDDQQVVAIAWGAPSNKYNGDDPRGVDGLWAEAMKAKADTQQEETDFPEDVYEEKTAARANDTLTNFLTPEEQDEIRNQISFIDEWITWAGTRTDAPAEYHRAAAMALLSTVYSEFGHAAPNFAKDGLKLNIWFMVLGRSTKDRKSTARRYMNDALRALKTDDYSYQLGDDVTPGGVSLALHDRAHRDEVQGLFKELLHQSYMSGGTEVFTKLYDGWSGGRVRASGDKKIMESVPVSFIMYMTGILSEATDVLTVTNYRSGFLTRFVYILGRRAEGFRSKPMEQESEEDSKEDKVFNSLVNHLITNRNYWEMYGGEGKLYKLRADDDAWKRLQQFEVDANAKAEESPYAEIISSTTERMIITTLKLATLLAMDDRSHTVKRTHMLQAIAYAGEWFDNAVTVASMVSESEWQRNVDDLERYINSKGGRVSYGTAYSQFKSMKPKDFEDMVTALQQRGVLNRIGNGNKWVLELDYSE
jgi:hypothetical protein